MHREVWRREKVLLDLTSPRSSVAVSFGIMNDDEQKLHVGWRETLHDAINHHPPMATAAPALPSAFVADEEIPKRSHQSRIFRDRGALHRGIMLKSYSTEESYGLVLESCSCWKWDVHIDDVSGTDRAVRWICGK